MYTCATSWRVSSSNVNGPPRGIASSKARSFPDKFCSCYAIQRTIVMMCACVSARQWCRNGQTCARALPSPPSIIPMETSGWSMAGQPNLIFHYSVCSILCQGKSAFLQYINYAGFKLITDADSPVPLELRKSIVMLVTTCDDDDDDELWWWWWWRWSLMMTMMMATLMMVMMLVTSSDVLFCSVRHHSARWSQHQAAANKRSPECVILW